MRVLVVAAAVAALLATCSARPGSAANRHSGAAPPARSRHADRREASTGKAPHIVFILVDDLGFNDVSFRGSSQVPTPHIDGLASSGQVLNQYYVNPVCSPTRGSLMSGRSEIHTGIQFPYDGGLDVSGLNLSYAILPQTLKQSYNYSTAMIGKWHLGMKTHDYVPSARGFDRYFGYYTGVIDYWLKYDDLSYGVKGLDLHTGGVDLGMRPGYDEPVTNTSGFYSSTQWGDVASSWIHDHASSRPDNPLFMYLAFQGIHSSNNKYVQAPNASLARVDYVSPNTTCGQYELTHSCSAPAARKTVAAAVTAVDDAIGVVLQALEVTGMRDDTLIVVSTDNGGPTHFANENMASNWPLRGCKAGFFEGGVRGVGVINGAGLKRGGGYVNNGLMHVSDWMETFVAAAEEATGVPPFRRSSDGALGLPGGVMTGASGLRVPPSPPVAIGDGVNNWAMLRDGDDATPSARTEIIHAAQAPGSVLTEHALRSGDLKLVWNPNSLLGWYAPPGGMGPGPPPKYSVTVDCCGEPPAQIPAPCTAEAPCLFNLSADPCEFHNLASDPAHASDVARLQQRIAEYAATAVLPWENGVSSGSGDDRGWGSTGGGDPYSYARSWAPGGGSGAAQPQPDPAANPAKHGMVWTPWLTPQQALKYYPSSYDGPGPLQER